VSDGAFFNGLWPPALQPIELDDDEAHVWLVHAGAENLPLERLHDSLVEDEQQRAARFHFDKHRRLYIAAHAALRSILSTYLNIRPNEIELLSGEHGKPALATAVGSSGLEFNLSHSNELALVAVARACALGVDVEYAARNLDFPEIARRFFTPAEVATLFNLPEPLQRLAFFKCWTSKEAFLKAKGTGLSGALDEVEIALSTTQQVHVNAVVPGWSLYELPLDKEYVAALAIQGLSHRIRCYGWQPAIITSS
jgi:4'-phosphopantetheinyl transferase